jgi:hypothetical protein
VSRKQEPLRYSPKNRRFLHIENREKSKSPQDHVLIVCEDSKHSVSYFNALIKDIGLTPKNVNIYGEECGSAPQSVYAYAQEKLEQSFKNGDCYDQVYCVFDVDGHSKLEATLAQISSDNQSQKNCKNIVSIISDPCFEYWLLLHFDPVTKPISSQDLEKKLKKYLTGYTKKTADYKNLYNEFLKDKTSIAIKHSKQTFKNAKAERRQNPSTNLHVVIEALLKEVQK